MKTLMHGCVHGKILILSSCTLLLCFGNALYVIQKSASLVAGKSVADVGSGYVKTVHTWRGIQKDVPHVANMIHNIERLNIFKIQDITSTG